VLEYLFINPSACPAFGCFGCWSMWLWQWCPRPLTRWRNAGTAFKNTVYFHKDCGCGMPCAGGTHFILFGCAFIGTRHIIIPWFGATLAGLAVAAPFNLWLFLAAVSHWMCMSTDPGCVPKEAIPPPGEAAAAQEKGRTPRKCPRSGIYKPAKSHFSSEIGRQVVKMDHHCPWMNNTIGIGNQKLFILFLVYVWLASIYAIILVVTCAISCRFQKSAVHRDPSLELPPWCAKSKPDAVILTILLMIASGLFGLFTTCILCEQMTSIITSDTYIDRLQARYRKGPAPPKPTVWQSLEEVFGNQGSRGWWLLPVRPRHKDPLKILGYDLPGPKEEPDLEIGDSTPSELEPLTIETNDSDKDSQS